MLPLDVLNIMSSLIWALNSLGTHLIDVHKHKPGCDHSWKKNNIKDSQEHTQNLKFLWTTRAPTLIRKTLQFLHICMQHQLFIFISSKFHKIHLVGIIDFNLFSHVIIYLKQLFCIFPFENKLC